MGLHIRIDLSNPFNHRDVAVFHCTQYSPLLLEIGVIDAWIWCPTFRVWNNQFDWGRGFSLNRPKEIPRALGDTDWSFASREQTSTIHLARQGAFTLTTWPCMWSPGAVAKQHNSITFSRLCMSIAFLLPSTKSVDRVGLFGWVCVSLQGPQHSDQRRVFDATLQRPFNWVAVNASFLLKIVQCIRKGLSSGSCYRIPDVSNAYFVIKERSNTPPFRNWPGRDLEPKIRSAPNHILWGVKKNIWNHHLASISHNPTTSSPINFPESALRQETGSICAEADAYRGCVVHVEQATFVGSSWLFDRDSGIIGIELEFFMKLFWSMSQHEGVPSQDRTDHQITSNQPFPRWILETLRNLGPQTLTFKFQ